MQNARARFSTSLDDRAITDCFLVAQEIKVGPKKMQYLVIDRRSMELEAQSKFEYDIKAGGPKDMGSLNVRVPWI